jgi:hypothetical protein
VGRAIPGIPIGDTTGTDTSRETSCSDDEPCDEGYDCEDGTCVFAGSCCPPPWTADPAICANGVCAEVQDGCFACPVADVEVCELASGRDGDC